MWDFCSHDQPFLHIRPSFNLLRLESKPGISQDALSCHVQDHKASPCFWMGVPIRPRFLVVSCPLIHPRLLSGSGRAKSPHPFVRNLTASLGFFSIQTTKNQKSTDKGNHGCCLWVAWLTALGSTYNYVCRTLTLTKTLCLMKHTQPFLHKVYFFHWVWWVFFLILNNKRVCKILLYFK